MNEVKLVKLVDTYKIDFTLHWKTFFHRQCFKWLRLEGPMKDVGKYCIKELLSTEIRNPITLHSG